MINKVLGSLLLLLSITLNAQELIEGNNKLEASNLKHFEAEYNANGAIDKETGFMRINNSETFQSKYQEAKDIAMDYLQSKLKDYGLADLNEFKIRKVAKSLTGEFVYFNQYINEIPVYLTNFTVFIDTDKIVRFASNEFRNISKERKERLIASLPESIKKEEAIDVAKRHFDIAESDNIIPKPEAWQTYFESKDRGLILTGGVYINCHKPAGNGCVFVDANDGRVVHIENHIIAYPIAKDVPALVYDPNPLVTKQVFYGGNYVGGSSTNSTLDAARVPVILKDVIYDTNGEFYQIDGPYCYIEEREEPIPNNMSHYYWPFSPDPPYVDNTVQVSNDPPISVIDYKRNQREFATINCYYHIDKSARRLIELGYYIDNTGLKGFAVDPHGLRYDNALAHFVYRSPLGHNYTYIAFKDFTDRPNASEDGDVIWHEHAHAIQYHVGVGLRGTSVEDKSVKEGCSFYWPTSYKLSISNYRGDEFALGVNRGGGGGVANYSLKYPNNFVNNLDNVHNNGLIFSAALLKIRENIVAQTNSLAGRDIADKLFIEMHYRGNQTTNFYNAANAYLESSKYYDNGKWYCLVFNTLNSFGLIANIDATHQITGTFTSSTTITDVNISMQNVTISSGTVKVKACNDVNLDNVTIKSGATLEIEAGGAFRVNYANLTIEAGAQFVVI